MNEIGTCSLQEQEERTQVKGIFPHEEHILIYYPLSDNFYWLFEREIKFGQKSDMHSECTSVKIVIQPATHANRQEIFYYFLL